MSFFEKPARVSFLTPHLIAPVPKFSEVSLLFETTQGSTKVIFGQKHLGPASEN